MLAMILAAALSTPAPAMLQAPALDRPAPDFTLPALDGREITLSRLRGKVVVINFFATWCPPCRAETPDLVAAEKRYARDGVTFVGVDQREDPALVRAFAKAKAMRFAVALDGTGKISKRYDVRAIPSTYVVDRKGIVRYRQVDQLDRSTLDGVLAAAIANRRMPQAPAAIRFAAIAGAAQREVADDSAKAAAAIAQRNLNGAEAAAADAIKIGNAANSKLDALQNAPRSASIGYFDSTRQRGVLNERLAAAYELRAHATADVAAAKKDEEQAALLRGQVAEDQERFAEAERWYGRALALDPKDAKALDGAYLAAYELHDYSRAAEIAKDRTMVAPSDPESWLTVASADLPLKRYAQALDAAREALTLSIAAYTKDPTKAAAAYEVGRVWLKMARVEIAAGNPRAAGPLLRDASAAAPGTIVAQQADEQTAALAPPGGVAVAISGLTTTSGSALTAAHLFVTVRNPNDAPRAIHLRSAGLPPHWVLSFCYGTVCDPYKSTITLAARATRRIELQVAPLADAGGRWTMRLDPADRSSVHVEIRARSTRAAVTVSAS